MTATEMGYRPPKAVTEHRGIYFTEHNLLYHADVPVEAIERHWFGQYPPEGYNTTVRAGQVRDDGTRLVVVRRYSSTGD